MEDDGRTSGDGRFLTADDTSLYYRWRRPAAERGRVVLVHGATEHGERYGHLVEALLAAGWSFYAFDHRGHGRSEGLRGHVSDFSTYAHDLTAFLEHINRTSAAVGLANVTAVLGRIDSVTLPPGSSDVAFLCDTYHHLEAVEPTLASIHQALRPGGRLVVVDFERIPGESRQWILDHTRAGKDEFRREIEAAGFSFVEEIEIPGFEENYFLKFKKK